MWPKSYHRLSQSSSSLDEENFSPSEKPYSSPLGWKGATAILGALLAVSTIINALLLHQRFRRPWDLYNVLPTQHAQLRRDVPRDMVPPEHFSSLNRTIQNAAWNDPSLRSWDLFVALDESYVVSQGLPHAQRWPWDLTKGVYIPIAAHELHCVNILRIYANEKEDYVSDADLTWSYAHTIHCLNLLRDSVICNADDQLMYTGRLHANLHFEEPEAGRGTMRMCRNWDHLMDWAHSHSACYLSVNREDPDFREVDRYKFCPDGSRPWERA